MTNRFKGLDLIDRVPDELWTEVRDIVQETEICREPAYCILSAALSTASSFRIWNSSIGILSLPGAGAPPMAKVMRKEAWHTQRRDRASGVPLEILEHLPPKPESAYFLLCVFTYTSDFMGAVPHYLSLKKELAYSSS